MPTFLEAHARVCDLVNTFEANRAVYMAADYKEAQARDDFLTPLFIALGWDVLHSRQRDPKQQEVKIEKSVVMTEGNKSADYSFALAPAFERVHFFVEAKKPSKKLPNAEDCFQAIRYGYNVGNPISVLTDFEDIFIMDCRAKPDLSGAKFLWRSKWHYRDLLDPDKFQTLYDLLSRDAVANGSIEQFVADLSAIPGSAGRRFRLFGQGAKPVDEEFLLDLEAWRGRLADAFLRGRPSLDAPELTEITQRALDRLVFLRFLEDKLIEPEDRVSRWTDGDAWRSFRAAAHSLNARYNGVLWREHPILDDPAFAPSGTTWADICFRISNRETPFLFNLIPIPLLGSIYERFLGNEIVVEGGRVEVEPKPEVRKAGGVYYTPEYIVSYICAHTLGPLTSGRTPAQVARLRVADISCGSGSFLLGAYDFLLRWHTAFYNANPAQARRDKCLEDDGIFRLSLAQRRAILLNNIWGNDIDAQAVEVSKLSLYLKLLEDETDFSARQFSLDLGERVLPDLDRNIVCGNSLVDHDIDATPEERAHINPMDWQATFPAILKGGGFDAIIGNPPYVRIQTMQDTMPLAPPYYREHYASAAKGNYDIYVVFIEKALELLNPKGSFSYILPHKFFNAQYGAAVRALMADGKHLSGVVHFGDLQIFENATTYTCLLFGSKAPADSFVFSQVNNLADWRAGNVSSTALPADLVTGKDWNFSVASTAALVSKLAAYPHKLKDVTARIGQGIRTSANEIYVLEERKRQIASDGTEQVVALSLDGQNLDMDARVTSRFLAGRDIKRYTVAASNRVVIMPYKLENGRATLRSEEELQDAGVWPYLNTHKTTLSGREGGRMEGAGWYGFVYPKNIELMQQPKILVPDIADRAAFALDAKGEYALTSGYGITLKTDAGVSLHYVLGILNSKLLSLFIKSVSTPMRGGFFRYFTQYVEQMPIRAINFSDPADKKKHDAMVSLVDKMLGAKAERARATTEKAINRSEGLIASLERRLDDLVYELYGLDAAEIALVEGGSAPTDGQGASEEGEGGA